MNSLTKNVCNDRLAIFVLEITKQYAISGYPCPTEDILLARAKETAQSLPEVPDEWITMTYRVARREAPDPKIYHLLKAWSDSVIFKKKEYDRLKNPPKSIARQERMSPEEDREARANMFEMIAEIAGKSIIPDEIVKKYGIK